MQLCPMALTTSLPDGAYNIQVTPAGLTEPVVISATLAFTPESDYTIAATDVLTQITPIVLMDDNSAPAAGQAHVRFIHTSPNAPAVDVALEGGAVLFGNVAFQEASGYLPVPASSTPHRMLRQSMSRLKVAQCCSAMSPSRKPVVIFLFQRVPMISRSASPVGLPWSCPFLA